MVLQAPQAGALSTVWVKRMDVAGAQFVEVENVDLEQTVSKFKARWLAQAKLDVDPSLVTLRLVKCGARKPAVDDEAEADVLDDPRLTLASAGLTDGCSLLAFVAIVGNIAAARPASVLSVASHARGHQQMSEWHVSTQQNLDRHLAHGLLWLMDSSGELVSSVVVLSELSHEPSAKYYFQRTSEAGAVEAATAAINNLSSGAKRESTRGIADDKLVQQTYGAVTVLFGGEPFEFCDGEQLMLEVDGLLGTEDYAWVLLNSAKFTAGKADVYKAIGSASKLHGLLRLAPSIGHPSLAQYAGARVHAFLSATHFLPGVPELAVQAGVTPVLCSGKRYRIMCQSLRLHHFLLLRAAALYRTNAVDTKLVKHVLCRQTGLAAWPRERAAAHSHSHSAAPRSRKCATPLRRFVRRRPPPRRRRPPRRARR